MPKGKRSPRLPTLKSPRLELWDGDTLVLSGDGIDETKNLAQRVYNHCKRQSDHRPMYLDEQLTTAIDLIARRRTRQGEIGELARRFKLSRDYVSNLLWKRRRELGV